MILLADESIDGPIVERLRHEGHQVDYVAELSPSIADDGVLNLANQSNAILLTADKDFGELVYRQRKVHSGVILLRLSGMTMIGKCDHVATVIRKHEAEFVGRFSVIDPGLLRIRQSP